MVLKVKNSTILIFTIIFLCQKSSEFFFFSLKGKSNFFHRHILVTLIFNVLYFLEVGPNLNISTSGKELESLNNESKLVLGSFRFQVPQFIPIFRPDLLVPRVLCLHRLLLLCVHSHEYTLGVLPNIHLKLPNHCISWKYLQFDSKLFKIPLLNQGSILLVEI